MFESGGRLVVSMSPHMNVVDVWKPGRHLYFSKSIDL